MEGFGDATGLEPTGAANHVRQKGFFTIHVLQNDSLLFMSTNIIGLILRSTIGFYTAEVRQNDCVLLKSAKRIRSLTNDSLLLKSAERIYFWRVYY